MPSGSRLRCHPALAALGLTVALVASAPAAHAEPLPSGSIGVLFGAGGGTGPYAHRLGLGYHQFGSQAAWQPMTTERRVGWSLKWSFVFGTMYYSDSARIDLYLRTLQLDFMAGVRIRRVLGPAPVGPAPRSAAPCGG